MLQTLLSLFLFQTALASPLTPDDVRLSTIVVEGSAPDILNSDPILPSFQGFSRGVSGSGGLEQSVGAAVALPMSEEQKPGSLAQLRGFGRSAEDTQVQALGVPLNPPLGGGFNFSTFPQFFWKSFEYRAGPSLAGFDPRGVAGTLTLIPWTADALLKKREGGDLIESFSQSGVNQFSAGFSNGSNTALLAGLSSGDVRGPSAGLSEKWSLGGIDGKIHLLATSLDSKSSGTAEAPTPNAHLYTARFVPVVQADIKIQDLIWKTSAFADWGMSRYNDADHPLYSTLDHTNQIGLENALIHGAWKGGLSFRQARYARSDFEAPTDTIGNFQVTYSGGSEEWLVEPTIQATVVTGYGLSPAGSLGARKEWGESLSTAVRLAFSRRFPSLQDRFYVFAPIFKGNPALSPEKDWTAISAVEWTPWPELKMGSELFFQLRTDAQVRTVDSIANSGSASVGALSVWSLYQVSRIFEVNLSGTLADSHVTATSARIPYLPRILTVGSLQAHFLPLRGGLSFRHWSDVIAPDLERMDSGGYLSVDCGGRVWSSGQRSLELTLSVENLLNSHAEITRGYPLFGRSIGAVAQGRF